MTIVVDVPVVEVEPAEQSAPDAAPSSAPKRARGPRSRNAQLRLMFVAWFAAVVVGLALVMYGFGPLFHQRDQRRLQNQYRGAIDRAANEASGLGGVTVASHAPSAGSPVGILEIGSIRFQEAVVEGVNPSETRQGPGHVPGTAGLGQPGNAAVVGRNKAFGGSFAHLDEIATGDEILVTTTQGPSVYVVDDVRTAAISTSAASSDSSSSSDASATTSAPATTTTTAVADASTVPGSTATTSAVTTSSSPSSAAPDSSSSGGTVSVDEVFGPSKDDRLTLVTSASAMPWNGSDARIVTAKLKTVAFAPTPQGGLDLDAIGTSGDRSALASVILALLAYGIVLGGSVALYRRASPRTAYLLTAAPIIAVTIIAAETMSRLFPAWM
jgi:sortase A